MKGFRWLVLCVTVAALILMNLSFLKEILEIEKNNSVSSAVNGTFDVYYFDVGQGDSALLVSGGQAMLIDAGERAASEYVLGALKALGIEYIDYVVATHPHSDHIGGMADVINNLDVKTVIMPDAIHTTKTFENFLDAIEENSLEITIAGKGDAYVLGDVELTVLSPDDEQYEDLNNYSIVLRAEFGDTSFLFMGDAEEEIENKLLGENEQLKSDIIKIGHHGSSTSSTQDFMYAVLPDYAVISCAKDNSYGHPHREVVRLLEEMGVNALKTYEMGTIHASSDGVSVSVSEADI